MTKKELLAYAALPLPKQMQQIPDNIRVCVTCLKDELKQTGMVYKDGSCVFVVRSKNYAYIAKRLKKFIDNITL